jgi:hypothetical protein
MLAQLLDIGKRLIDLLLPLGCPGTLRAIGRP